MSGKLFFPTVCLLLLISACKDDGTPSALRVNGQGADAQGDGDASTQETPASSDDSSGYGGGFGSYYSTGNISFIDDVATNVDVGDEIASLTFTDVEGNETRLHDYVGRKSVVLVITRGNTNPICPYCTTQTSRLIANYPKFVDRNTEVIVVYPIEHEDDAQRLESFLSASKKKLSDPNQPVPFPILLDVELKAVDKLGIRKDLSKPATYILDTDGEVRFAYVGADVTDRPSVTAVLKELDEFTPPLDGTSVEGTESESSE
ncbi:MAG: peroxiredoxin family protein [Planctomycetaceae bacterium]|nr:peroxiredoxin family protein [Planctomycetaceae bacterium]